MKPSVLLVEDDPAFRLVMREMLEDEYEVGEAGNGREGVARVESGGVDLIVLDYNLPYKDGLTVLKEVRQTHPEVHVVVVSGFLDDLAEERFRGLGVNSILPKPFNMQLLLQTIRDALPTCQNEEPTLAQVLAFPGKLPPSEREVLLESLGTLSHLSEKLEFLRSISEKYVVTANDMVALRHSARLMDADLRRFYGYLNEVIWDIGQQQPDSPLLKSLRLPNTDN